LNQSPISAMLASVGKKTAKTGGLKLDMDFDEAMRRVSKIKPKKPAKRKK